MTEQKSGSERRITIRLLAYWEKMRRGRLMPVEQDIDPDDMGELWEHCFLIHVSDLSKDNHQFTYLGPEIEKAFHGGLSEAESGDLVSPNAAKFNECYLTVIKTCKPLVDEGEFYNLRGELVKYRQCLLPLGEGGTVQAVFGGMRSKIFHTKN